MYADVTMNLDFYLLCLVRLFVVSLETKERGDALSDIPNVLFDSERKFIWAARSGHAIFVIRAFYVLPS